MEYQRWRNQNSTLNLIMNYFVIIKMIEEIVELSYQTFSDVVFSHPTSVSQQFHLFGCEKFSLKMILFLVLLVLSLLMLSCLAWFLHHIPFEL